MLEKLVIAIPIHNEGRYLRETVESCVGQAGRIILCDNASDDGSSEICAELAAKHPVVEHLKQEKNVGAFLNFKVPLFMCDTEYFCWIGGHDRIDKDYTLHLLRHLEENPEIGFAAGTIQHIDEEGRELNRPVRSEFLNSAADSGPLDRVEALAWHLRDCFIFHAVHRTALLREAWHEKACLGIDRITLFRMVAIAKAAYVPEAVLYARDFPATRNTKEDSKRRSEVLAEGGPVAKSNFERNLMLVRTTLDLAHDDASLSHAFRIIGKIRSRHHERRRFRKIIMLKIACGIVLLLLLVILAIY